MKYSTTWNLILHAYKLDAETKPETKLNDA